MSKLTKHKKNKEPKVLTIPIPTKPKYKNIEELMEGENISSEVQNQFKLLLYIDRLKDLCMESHVFNISTTIDNKIKKKIMKLESALSKVYPTHSIHRFDRE